MRNRIIFDTCGLSNLFKRYKESEEVLSKLLEKFEIIISVVNICEIMQHGNIEKRNDLLNFCKKLNYNDYSPIDLPSIILKNTLKDYLALKKTSKAGDYKFKIFIDDPSEITEDNIKMATEILQSKENIFQASNADARDYLSKNNNKFDNSIPSDQLNFLNTIMNNNNLLDSFFTSACKSPGFKKTNIKGHKIIRDFEPWTLYWGAYFLGIYNLGFKNEYCSPKKNAGYIDVSQAVYLYACDYFVTDDNALYKLLNILIESKYLKSQKKVLNVKELLNSYNRVL